MKNIIVTALFLLLSANAFACYDGSLSNRANFDNCLVEAQQGDAKAQDKVGMYYDFGWDVPENDELAFRWYKKAAEHGIKDSQVNIAYMYGQGRGVARDDKLAEMWAQKAALQGANLNRIRYNLGNDYKYGENGATKDYKQAIKWYTKAAEQGYPDAQTTLGNMYSAGEGEGLPQNYKLAVKWFKKAAEQGDVSAQRALSLEYAAGVGLPQNYVMAHMWSNIAGATDIRSARLRDMIAKEMTPSQIEKAQDMAREWMAKHQ